MTEAVKGLVKKVTNSLMDIQEDPDFDASLFAGVDSKDILIPKLLLAQSMTHFVQDEAKCPVTGAQVKPGDIVNSITGEIVCARNEEVKIHILSTFKTWAIYDVTNDNKFLRIEPFTPANAGQAWEGEELDEKNMPIKVKRVQAINAYIMLESDLLNPAALPMVIRFSSTSFKTGKILTNFMTKAQMLKKNPYYKPVFLKSIQESNASAKWYEFTMDIETGLPLSRESQASELDLLKTWSKTVTAGSGVKVDESDSVPF